MTGSEPSGLAEIRRRIDAIDEDVHRLLIERGRVIDALIRIKGTSRPAGAFRPAREAEMMRRLVLRHEGGLPLATVEHIWREIITTFTAMQAPFGVIAGPAADPLAMRDLVRFYVGFSVEVTGAARVADALARVADPGHDIAVVAADAGGRWWAPLMGARAPKVFAKLPFIETAARPALPSAYVVGPPLADGAAPDVRLLAVAGAGDLSGALAALGGRIVRAAEEDWLVELPESVGDDDLAAEVEARAGRLDRVADLGGFSAPIRILEAGEEIVRVPAGVEG